MSQDLSLLKVYIWSNISPHRGSACLICSIWIDRANLFWSFIRWGSQDVTSSFMLVQLNAEAIEMIMQPFHHLDHFIVLQHGYSDRTRSYDRVAKWLYLPDVRLTEIIFVIMKMYYITFPSDVRRHLKRCWI